MKRTGSGSVLAATGILALFCALGLGARGQTTPGTAAQQLVILDTDIGDDIDDAFALALLLQSPEIKLLGVTTAYGNTELRMQLVERYLNAVGRGEIPVTAGEQTPAKNMFTQAAYARQGGNPAGDRCTPQSVSQLPQRAQERYKSCEKDRHDAAGFLLRAIQAHPGEITLIAIGPLFNVQAAIARDAATFRKLKRVVIMGGSVYRGYDAGTPGTAQPPSPEWNILCDPAGARALLASGVPVFVMPLDSTQIHMAPQELATILSHGSPLSDQLALLYHQWTGAETWRMPTLFDPLAVSYTLRPELCPMRPIHLDIDEQGYTKPGPGAANAQVCLKSEEERFRAFLLERILGDTGK